MDLLQSFEKNLQRKKLICPGDAVYVGCSGGPDSVALAHLLHRLAARWNLSLGLLHINHGLRGAAAAKDADFVKSYAKKLKIPCRIARGGVQSRAKQKKYSIEEAAREVRYENFQKMAQRLGIQKIALAHNLDDQAETILMRMIEGTGMRGLMGIREIRREKGIVYVRPLLPFKKKEILNYLKSNDLKYCIDRTNQSRRFKRNKIRQSLLPHLEKNYNPRVVEALARIPSIVSEESAYLQKLEIEAFSKVVCYTRAEKIYFSRKAFMALPGPIQFRVLSRALAKIDPASGIHFEQWETLRSCFDRASYCQSLRRDIDIELNPSRVKVYKKYSVR